MSDPMLQQPEFQTWLSSHRAAVYIARAGGSVIDAQKLYDWNAAITGAVLRDLSHLEVCLRNVYDVELSRASQDWTSPASIFWSREQGVPQTRAKQRAANEGSKKALRDAAGRAPQRTHGHVVANLSFGFWTKLSVAERESTVWTPTIGYLFPGVSRGDVHDRMTKLNTFRNRLAHWEPVFSKTSGLMNQLSRMDDMFGMLGPDLRPWVAARSAVPTLLRNQPVPVIGGWSGTYLSQTV